MDKFYYLKFGLSLVLLFVGVKMVMVDIYKIPIGLSLSVVASILTLAVVASVWRTHRFTVMLKRKGMA
jgi:tellurite resistance protein TerC